LFDDQKQSLIGGRLLRIVVAATLSTVFVILVGFLIVLPLFTRAPVDNKKQIMLSFSVVECEDVTSWCSRLSSMLESYDVPATVYFVGKVVEEHPGCVSFFGEGVDVGSQTFSNLNLTGISDYSVQLEEVSRGKLAVDAAGNLYSRVFRAPNGFTDENIYSLLSRNGILADFSYTSQYNVYLDGQFVKFDAVFYEGESVFASSILALESSSQPVIVHFDSECPIELISDYVSLLKTGDFVFVNGSMLTGLNLTLRGDS
jgi:peptidoglycan/xylan/chitin deacetylase (PgdA/CDA1 family)